MKGSCVWTFATPTSASLGGSITFSLHKSVYNTHRQSFGYPTQYLPTCTANHSVEMSTHFEQLPSYEISISQGSKAPDDNTLVGSGDLIVRWPDGRGRRYRDKTEISNSLALLGQSVINDAIKTSLTIQTYIPYELGRLASEGESILSVDVTPIDLY
jgi:hypothetical protein